MSAPSRERTGSGPGLRLATVYQPKPYPTFRPQEMSTVRWYELSAALARAGFRVDMVIDAEHRDVPEEPGLRLVPFREARWDRYDAVLALFHRGFEAIEEVGAADHPFIISELGSVVGPEDGTPGVHFFGAKREALWATQLRIADGARRVALLTEPSRELWARCHGGGEDVLIVPTAVPARVPEPRADPYREWSEPIALYLGSIYRVSQREINLYWQERLNAVGHRLRDRGIRLCFAGPGFTDRIDPTAVTCLGPVAYRDSWDHLHHARVGLVLAQGPRQDNESSKLYHYLRVGLPAVSEAPVPNNGLIEETGLGLIAGFEDDDRLADLVAEAATTAWEPETAMAHMLEYHTWDHRAALYRDVILRELGHADDRVRAGTG